MRERRATISWAAAPDEGNAAAASADIEAFLAQPGGRDWEDVLRRMREALTRLCVAPLLRADPVCREIIAALPEAADMMALDAAIDRLRERVGALVAARGRAPAAALLEPAPGRRPFRN